MSSTFDAYAAYYDLLYKNKDYAEESSYIASLLPDAGSKPLSILELGCGTGAHAEHLALMGHNVHGIDLSDSMLEKARQRKTTLDDSVAQRLQFEQGDVRTWSTDKQFDVVISLFHVMSYQNSNAEVDAMIKTAMSHLQPGGTFIFDFWYGPAVLEQKPESRVKRFTSDAVKITRIAEPVSHENINVVDVNYDIFIEELANGNVTQVQETHPMRYLFLPELELFLQQNNASVEEAYAWLKDTAPSKDEWASVIVSKRHE